MELLEDAFFMKRREGPDVQRRPSTAALDSHSSGGDAAAPPNLQGPKKMTV